MKNDLLAAIACLALLSGVALADPNDKKKPTETPGPKVVVLHLDASKLPPDVLAKLLAAAKPEAKPTDNKPQPGDKKPGEGGKPGGEKKPGDAKPQPGGEKKPEGAQKGKSIGLADAVSIAEKHAKGTAFRAESEDNGFVVGVKARSGAVKVFVDQLGKASDKGIKKGEAEKPGKKKNEENEGNKPGKE